MRTLRGINTAAFWTAAVLAALLLARIAVSYWFYRANLGFSLVFGDGAMRALTSYDWSLWPTFWISAVMPPLPFWIMGSAAFILGDLTLMPVVVNTSFSLGSMALLFLITRRLFPEEPAAPVLAAVLGGFHAGSLLFGTGGLAIPCLTFFLLAGAWFFVRLEERRKDPALLLMALSLLAATMSRWDGWVAALVATALIAWRAIRLGRGLPGRIEALSALMLLWSYTSLFFFHKWGTSGQSPLAFLQHMRAIRPAVLPLRGWITPFTEIGAVFPVIVALGLFMVLVGCAARRRGSRGRAADAWLRYALFPLGYFVLLVPLYGAGLVVPFCHYTHLYPAAVLFVPLAAGGAARALSYAAPGLRPPLAVVLGLCFMGYQLMRFSDMSVMSTNYGPGIIKVSALLRSLWKREALGESDRVMLELHRSELDSRGRIWESLLPLLLKPPETSPQVRDGFVKNEHILFDRAWRHRILAEGVVLDERDNPSLFESRPGEILKALRARGVRIVAAHSSKTRESLRPIMREAAAFGSYRLFVFEGDRRLLAALRRAASEIGRSPLIFRRRIRG